MPQSDVRDLQRRAYFRKAFPKWHRETYYRRGPHRELPYTSVRNTVGAYHQHKRKYRRRTPYGMSHEAEARALAIDRNMYKRGDYRSKFPRKVMYGNIDKHDATGKGRNVYRKRHSRSEYPNNKHRNIDSENSGEHGASIHKRGEPGNHGTPHSTTLATSNRDTMEKADIISDPMVSRLLRETSNATLNDFKGTFVRRNDLSQAGRRVDTSLTMDEDWKLPKQKPLRLLGTVKEKGKATIKMNPTTGKLETDIQTKNRNIKYHDIKAKKRGSIDHRSPVIRNARHGAPVKNDVTYDVTARDDVVVKQEEDEIKNSIRLVRELNKDFDIIKKGLNSRLDKLKKKIYVPAKKEAKENKSKTGMYLSLMCGLSIY